MRLTFVGHAVVWVQRDEWSHPVGEDHAHGSRDVLPVLVSLHGRGRGRRVLWTQCSRLAANPL